MGEMRRGNISLMEGMARWKGGRSWPSSSKPSHTMWLGLTKLSEGIYCPAKYGGLLLP